MSPFLEPGETTRTSPEVPVGMPPAEAKTETETGGPEPRNRSRSRGRSPGRGRSPHDPPDPDLPPEPTQIPEAEGRRTTGEPTPGRRTASRPRPATSRPRRPSVSDDTVGWPDGDATGSTHDAFERLAQAGEAGARRKAPATAKHWEDFLAVLLGFLSMLYCWWLLAGLDVPREERESLMLQEDEAEGLATPLARIMARSWINQTYGKHVLGGSDWIVMAIALAEYGRRTHPYLRRRLGALVPGRRPGRPTVEPDVPRRRAAAEERNGHVDGAPARPAGPVIFPAQAT